jgi:hypothetical protein
MTTIEFAVYAEQIKQKLKRGESKYLFDYIRKINRALARLNVKKRFFSEYDPDELYFIYMLLSGKFPKQEIAIELINYIAEKLARVWTLTLSTLDRKREHKRFTLTIHTLSPDIAGVSVIASLKGKEVWLEIIREGFVLEGKFGDVIDDLMSLIVLYRKILGGD